MFGSLLIITVSTILLAYWFRYVCILLLRDRAISADYRFSFGRLEEGLRNGEPLDALERSLQKDYEVVRYLLRHTTHFDVNALEYRALALDYKLMRWWYRLTRIAAPERALEAVREMAAVLSYLFAKTYGHSAEEA